MKDIYIIILNYNQKRLTTECINSILNSTYVNYKILVVDNGSKDGSVEYLSKLFKGKIKIIINSNNYGFSKGNNIGIKYALEHGAEYLFLINNDTVLHERCIEILYDRAKKEKHYSFYCPKIFYHDNPEILWYAGGDINLRKPNGVVHYGFNEKDSIKYDKDREISFATGCAIFCHRDTFFNNGMLTENFFIYSEDVDWSKRIQNARGIGLYVSNACMWHKVGQAFSNDSNKQLKRIYLFSRNRFIVQRNYRGILSTFIMILIYFSGKASRKALIAFMKLDYRPLFYLIIGIYDGIKSKNVRVFKNRS